MHTSRPPSEGDIYKKITVSGKTFVILYGYYSDKERDGEPMPVLPDFDMVPVYDGEGRRLVTRIQDACKHYKPKTEKGDGWCSDCEYFPDPREDIGICQCENNNLIE